MSTLFRFLHLTDFHICIEARRANLLTLAERRTLLMIDTCISQLPTMGFLSLAKPSSYSPAVVSGAAQFCFACKDDIDGVVLTGDLATSGFPTDISEARAFVLNSATSGFMAGRKPTLAGSGLPTWVIPGNHDKYQNYRASPTSPNFGVAFSNNMPNLSNRVSHRVIKKDNKHAILVFADFSLYQRNDARNSILGPFGQGRVYQQVLHELEDRTRLLRRKYPTSAVIWAIHFAPYNCGSSLELIDWQLVDQSASMMRINAVLCGHTHSPRAITGANTLILCGGSAGAIDAEYTSFAHIINVNFDLSVSVTRENWAFSFNDDEFVYLNSDP